MPATRLKAANSSASELKAVSQRYRICLQQVKEKNLDILSIRDVKKEGMTLRDLFRRAGFQTAEVAGAIPVADSTLRGIVSGRTQPSLPLTLMERLLTLLQVSWPAFVAAYEQTIEARVEVDQKKQNAA
jgi:hypothetical protein